MNKIKRLCLGVLLCFSVGAFADTVMVLPYNPNDETSFAKFKADLAREDGISKTNGRVYTVNMGRMLHKKAGFPYRDYDGTLFQQENGIGELISFEQLQNRVNEGGFIVPKRVEPQPVFVPPQQIVREVSDPAQAAEMARLKNLTDQVGKDSQAGLNVLAKKIDDFEKKLIALEKADAVGKASYEQLAKQLAELKNQPKGLTASDLARLKKLDEKVGKLVTKEQLTESLGQLKNQLVTTDSYNSLAVKVGGLQRQIKILNSTTDSQQVNRITKQLERLSTEVREFNSLQMQANEGYSVKLNSLDKRVGNLAEEKGELVKVVDSLKNELAKLSNSSLDKTMYAALSAKVDSLENDLSKKDGLSSHKALELTGQLNELIKEFREKSQVGDKNSRQIEELMSRLDGLENTVQAYNIAHILIGAENAIKWNLLSGKVSNLAEEKGELVKVVDSLKNELAKLSNSSLDKTMYAALSAKVDSLENDLSKKDGLSSHKALELTNQLTKLSADVHDLSKKQAGLVQRKEVSKLAENIQKRFTAIGEDAKNLLDRLSGVELSLKGINDFLNPGNDISLASKADLALKTANTAAKDAGDLFGWFWKVLLVIVAILFTLWLWARSKLVKKVEASEVAEMMQKSELLFEQKLLKSLPENTVIKKLREDVNGKAGTILVTELTSQVNSIASDVDSLLEHNGAVVDRPDFDQKLQEILSKKEGVFTVLAHVGPAAYEVQVQYSHLEGGKTHFKLEGIAELEGPDGQTVTQEKLLRTISRAGVGKVRFTKPAQ